MTTYTSDMLFKCFSTLVGLWFAAMDAITGFMLNV